MDNEMPRPLQPPAPSTPIHRATYPKQLRLPSRSAAPPIPSHRPISPNSLRHPSRATAPSAPIQRATHLEQLHSSSHTIGAGDGREHSVCKKKSQSRMGGDRSFVRRKRSGGWEVTERLYEGNGVADGRKRECLYGIFGAKNGRERCVFMVLSEKTL